MEIGPTPSGENCAAVGSPNYETLAKIETRAFINQLERIFPEAKGRFKAKGFEHDFGRYYEVCVFFDGNDEKSCEIAYNVEANVPEEWDEEAKKELKAKGYNIAKPNPKGKKVKKKNPAGEMARDIVVSELRDSYDPKIASYAISAEEGIAYLLDKKGDSVGTIGIDQFTKAWDKAEHSLAKGNPIKGNPSINRVREETINLLREKYGPEVSFFTVEPDDKIAFLKDKQGKVLRAISITILQAYWDSAMTSLEAQKKNPIAVDSSGKKLEIFEVYVGKGQAVGWEWFVTERLPLLKPDHRFGLVFSPMCPEGEYGSFLLSEILPYVHVLKDRALSEAIGKGQILAPEGYEWAKSDTEKSNPSTLIPQSIHFSKKKWSKAEAVKWLKEHKFIHSKVDEGPNFYNYRQHDPKDCVKKSFVNKTFSVKEGISATLAKLK